MTHYRIGLGMVVALLIALIVGAFLYARSNAPGNDVSHAVRDAPPRP